MSCYYDVLNIKKTASPDEIKASYKKLVFKWHPDKNKDNIDEANEKIKIINEAYDTLKDPNKKRDYDMKNNLNRSLNAGSFNVGSFNAGSLNNIFSFMNNSHNMNNITINMNNNSSFTSSVTQTFIRNGKTVRKTVTTTVKNGVKTINEQETIID